MNRIILHVGDWATLGLDAARVRDAVFVREQQIPAALEWDEADNDALHAVAYSERFGERHPVGTGRLLETGAIGRMAVLREARRGGIGSRVLETLIGHAEQRGDAHVELYAQRTAVPFYLRHGFAIIGDEVEEAGIPHVQMVRVLRGPEAGG
ncbi:GNAT family N-acetyltransferase [Trinickia terrae]|uniref:GNAT family N-acetyltransferase n=1 Tax=Trinickia terrae TaxID=2571161 RepID=A0A4U1I223_9BURK|nr:GNAT family N-acetyltransferase [Trinickia terrae]TKC87233.1 GNAT family N-acetyltransferase [Trinickia terrae]